MTLRYTYDKQYDKTLEIYLRLKRDKAFELIRDHNLFNAVRDKVKVLMQYEEEKAVQLLIDNTERIPVRFFLSAHSDRTSCSTVT